MVSRFVSMALAFALAATVSFAAGESDSAGAAAAAEKKYVTDPTNGKVYTAPEYGGTLTYGSSSEPPNSDAMGRWYHRRSCRQRRGREAPASPTGA